jgi:hypothetical protein
MLMPGRQFTARISYRYGFNGKENNNESKGLGNELDYGMKIYDSRVGKRIVFMSEALGRFSSPKAIFVEE